jgi:hypothetical protein
MSVNTDSNDVAPKFVVGELYFRVTYADREQRYPSIEVFVFLGTNASDEDREETWYFQPSSDFGRRGSALSGDTKDRPVICVSIDSLAEMLSLTGLVETIRRAQSSAHRPL